MTAARLIAILVCVWLAGQAQAQPGVTQSADDALATFIDTHPSWGPWQGRRSRPENHIAAGARDGEARFYRSEVLRTWCVHGWRGLRRLSEPTRALRLIAVVLIRDQAARMALFAELGLDVRWMSAATPGMKRLGAARAAGNMDEERRAIGDVMAEEAGDVDAMDFEALKAGHTVHQGRFGMQVVARWRHDEVEIDGKAAELLLRRRKGRPGSEYRHGHGVVLLIESYALDDGSYLTREWWHRLSSDAMEREKGRRVLALAEAAQAVGPGDDVSAMSGGGPRVLIRAGSGGIKTAWNVCGSCARASPIQ